MRFLSISGVIVEVRVMRSSAPRRECDLFVSRASGQLAQVPLWEQRWNVRFIGEAQYAHARSFPASPEAASG
jgi:hypothetical protein